MTEKRGMEMPWSMSTGKTGGVGGVGGVGKAGGISEKKK